MKTQNNRNYPSTLLLYISLLPWIPKCNKTTLFKTNINHSNTNRTNNQEIQTTTTNSNSLKPISFASWTDPDPQALSFHPQLHLQSHLENPPQYSLSYHKHQYQAIQSLIPFYSLPSPSHKSKLSPMSIRFSNTKKNTGLNVRNSWFFLVFFIVNSFSSNT